MSVQSPGPGPTAVQPVPRSGRVAAVDILRGFALFGILMVNMAYFSQPLATADWARAQWTSAPDRLVTVLISFFFTGKFISLYAMLFGLGFGFQLRRAGAGATALFRRRLLVLLGIGAAHALLLWAGDVLLVYALVGFALLKFRTASPGRLLLGALVSLMLPILMATAFVGWIRWAQGISGGTAVYAKQFNGTEGYLQAENDAALRDFGTGSYHQIFWRRLADLGRSHAGMLVGGTYFQILGLFLLGLWAGRVGLPWRLGELAPRIGRWGALFLGVGLVGALCYTLIQSPYAEPVPSYLALLNVAGYTLGAATLALAYAAGVAWLALDPRRVSCLEPVRAAGQMGLTNYLMQSVICTTLFYSYGFGLFGRVGPVAGVGLTILIYMAELLWSRLWLRRFRFGPAEWLWRSLTYGEIQPLAIQ